MAELVCGTGDRDTWLTARREGITATDLPVILGLVTWDSPFALYWRKKGLLPEVEQSDRMRLGSWLEDMIAGYWYDNECMGGIDVGGLYRSTVRPWQLATPDRVVVRYKSLPEQEITAVLECKTSATRDGWGDDGTAEVPAHVRAQVLWQMDTLGVATGHVAVVFLPSGEFRSYTISHLDGCHASNKLSYPSLACKVCDDQVFMRERASEFYQRLLNDDPPPVDGLQVTTDALRHLNADAVKGKQAEIDATLAGAYRNACDDMKDAKDIKAELENEIRLEMEDATLAVADGEIVARREVFKRAGYEVPPAEVDRLVRVKPKEAKTDG